MIVPLFCLEICHSCKGCYFFQSQLGHLITGFFHCHVDAEAISEQIQMSLTDALLNDFKLSDGVAAESCPCSQGVTLHPGKDQSVGRSAFSKALSFCSYLQITSMGDFGIQQQWSLNNQFSSVSFHWLVNIKPLSSCCHYFGNTTVTFLFGLSSKIFTV